MRPGRQPGPGYPGVGSRCTTYAQTPPGCTPRLQTKRYLSGRWPAARSARCPHATRLPLRPRDAACPPVCHQPRATRPRHSGRLRGNSGKSVCAKSSTYNQRISEPCGAGVGEAIVRVDAGACWRRGAIFADPIAGAIRSAPAPVWIFSWPHMGLPQGLRARASRTPTRLCSRP
jgi:hypothetical protein